MKIRVCRSDSRIEVLTLVPPVVVEEWHDALRLTCGDGTDHFFMEDGTYEGWGRRLSEPIEGEEEGLKRAMEIENQREIEGDVT